MIPKPVKRALFLLKRDAKGKNIGKDEYEFTSETCPIALVYNIKAIPVWKRVDYGHKQILSDKGWTKIVYEAFISWHDSKKTRETVNGPVESFPNREYVLKTIGGKRNAA